MEAMKHVLNRGGKGIRLIGCDVSVRVAEVIQNVHHTKLNISSQKRNIQSGYTPKFSRLRSVRIDSYPQFHFFCRQKKMSLCGLKKSKK